MSKIRKQICLIAVVCILFLGGDATGTAQNINVPSEPPATDSRSPQGPSATRRILLNIAKAVIEVLCAEYGDCPSPATGTTGPDSREEGRYLNPGFAGDSSSSGSASQPRGFTFDTPPGWRSYEDQSSVTVARPSEYVNGDLINGVILGSYDLNGSSFESATEMYVRGLVSNNKYVKRVGRPESSVVGYVPCITNRMEGRSPKTQEVEKVVVYTCKRSSKKLFYVVTVNSGANSGWYDEQNLRITQSISFRQ